LNAGGSKREQTTRHLNRHRKRDLRDFLASYDAEREYLRENPYRPYFGQAPADILFTDEQDTAGQPDGYYFSAAGQEPPSESQEGASAFVVVLCAFVLIGLPVMALWAFFACFLPVLTNWFLALAGR
jgi:hypothetical protein